MKANDRESSSRFDSLDQLAVNLRADIKRAVDSCGGHYASPLGAVELSVALHHVFRSPQDRLVWDTGHQCYSHKLLTERRSSFDQLRRRAGVSGFPVPKESKHDAFGVGHASTSIAAAAGIAKALEGSHSWAVAIVGDAALAGGPALEALNLLQEQPWRVGVVLNDNSFSISESVGALNRDRPDSYRRLAKAIGLKYYGPVNGHCIEELVSTLEKAKQGGGFFLHAVTKKGKGDPRAERDPTAFHAVPAGHILSLEKEATPTKKSPRSPISFQDVFSSWLEGRLERDPGLLVLTPGMSSGAKLDNFSEAHPPNFLDVGIAEASAVTFAGGMASAGGTPIVHIYSTFLQRAVDQVIHDICLQGLPVTFIIDRCSLSGRDGPTHHGVFDLSYLSGAPNLQIWSLSSAEDLGILLDTVACKGRNPVAIRIFKGSGVTWPGASSGSWDPATEAAVVRRDGSDLTLVFHGALGENVRTAAELLSERGISCRVVECLRLLPLSIEDIHNEILLPGCPVLVAEEHVHSGSLGALLGTALSSVRGSSLLHGLCITNPTVDHGARTRQLAEVGLCPNSITAAAQSLLKRFQ